MVGVDAGSLYRRTHRLSRLAWSWVGGRLAPFSFVKELSQWLCHDNSTINIVFELLSVQCYAWTEYKFTCVFVSVCLSVCPSHFLSTRLQVRSINGFLQLIA